MKKHIYIYLLALCALFGCKDNSGLYGLLTDYDSRIAKLEQLCSQMNTNITSLTTIVEAQQSGETITSITPIMENGEVVGYTITFANYDPITIYTGKDGSSGTVPVIGAKQDTDGIYYWTIDGDWLLDEGGNKLPVTGESGAQGITPQLKIEGDYWWISYDNGATWTQLGQAKGDKGDDGDSMFQSVTQDENYVYFTLADGTVIKINKSGLSDFEQTVMDNMVNSLVLDQDTLYLIVGDTITIKSTTSPFPASTVHWSSLYDDVASVEEGLVTALHVGVTQLTAKAGDKTATCLVYVKGHNPLNTGFSVSTTKKVTFALGNLYKKDGLYYIGDAFSPNGDKFYWGETSGYENGSFRSSTYTQYQYNWGIHPIANSENIANEWRTLNCAEWKYVISERPNASQLKFLYNNAWFIFPDNTDYNDLTYFQVEKCISTAIWQEFVRYCKIVRLPMVGYITQKINETANSHSGGQYWTSEAKKRSSGSGGSWPTTGASINIDNGTIEYIIQDTSHGPRQTRCVVRLVKDVE